jgi:ketosteroid isomerase-like protein
MNPANAISAAIRTMVGAVNEGDLQAALEAFADSAVIIEDIPPYRWDGAGAVMAWLKAMGANAQRLGATEVAMELMASARTEVDGNRAYSVHSGRLSLGAGDSKLTADGQLTFTLINSNGAWLIDSLVWSGSQPG